MHTVWHTMCFAGCVYTEVVLSLTCSGIDVAIGEVGPCDE